jgi:branched-chain amino acid transport system permease protein
MTGPAGRRFAPYALMAVFGLVMALVPLAVSNQYYLTVLVIIALQAMLAMSLNLLIGYAGILSLAHSAFYGLGAYGYALATTTWNASPLTGIGCGVLLTVIVAALVGVPTTRLRSHYLAIATLGLAVIFVALAVEMVSLTGGPNGVPGIPPLGIGPLTLTSIQGHYEVIWAAALLTVAGSHTLVDSRVGRALRAMKTRETAAAILGVDVARIKLQLFVVSACVAGVAGVLYASFVSFVSPETFSFHLTIQLLVIMAMGGMGTIWGPVLGSFLVVIANEALRPAKEFSPLVFGFLLILFIVFAPAGLAGWWSRRRRAASEGAHAAQSRLR